MFVRWEGGHILETLKWNMVQKRLGKTGLDNRHDINVVQNGIQ